MAILEEDSVSGVYKIKFPNNHPFLERLRVEFYHTEQNNGHVSTTTRFFWSGPDAPISDTVYRLKGAYDKDG